MLLNHMEVEGHLTPMYRAQVLPVVGVTTARADGTVINVGMTNGGGDLRNEGVLRR